MNIPMISQANKNKAFLIGYVVFCLLYGFSGHHSIYSPKQFSLSPVDKMIPFMFNSIWIYHSHFLFVFYAMLTCQDELRRTIVYYAMLLATGIAFAIFMLMPTELPHPSMDFNGFSGMLWRALYLTDTPTNCFPSLHVALASLATCALMVKNTFWRWAAPLWGVLICVSTLTTKQHYAVDVVGGAVLAMLSFMSIHYLIVPRYRYENAHQ
ncbi:MAG: phosphatase PAP2 family protein [Gammaproteobacteria bacterium]|nr:phosphatase PAP2 family protein [Gammaproteobacteria bacterium]